VAQALRQIRGQELSNVREKVSSELKVAMKASDTASIAD